MEGGGAGFIAKFEHQLFCISVPGLPGDLESDNTTQRELTYSWQAPLCGERHGTIIKYGYEFSDSQSEQFTTLASVVFANLNHFTEYMFRIRAYTSAGGGNFTDWVTQRTAEAGMYHHNMNKPED